MSILRYSYIVDDFYGIKLPREKLALIDAHFLSASHHYFRCKSDDLALSRFHSDLFWKHLSAMMKIVQTGDFLKAFDNTRRGLNRPEGWNPMQRFQVLRGEPEGRKHVFPDPEMFIDMLPDLRFQPGDPHPYDALLDRPETKISEIYLEFAIA